MPCSHNMQQDHAKPFVMAIPWVKCSRLASRKPSHQIYGWSLLSVDVADSFQSDPGHEHFCPKLGRTGNGPESPTTLGCEADAREALANCWTSMNKQGFIRGPEHCSTAICRNIQCLWVGSGPRIRPPLILWPLCHGTVVVFVHKHHHLIL